MALIKPLWLDYAVERCEAKMADVQGALNATNIAIMRSTARIKQAESVMRRCEAALLTDRQMIERARQRLI